MPDTRRVVTRVADKLGQAPVDRSICWVPIRRGCRRYQTRRRDGHDGSPRACLRPYRRTRGGPDSASRAGPARRDQRGNVHTSEHQALQGHYIQGLRDAHAFEHAEALRGQVPDTRDERVAEDLPQPPVDAVQRQPDRGRDDGKHAPELRIGNVRVPRAGPRISPRRADEAHDSLEPASPTPDRRAFRASRARIRIPITIT